MDGIELKVGFPAAWVIPAASRQDAHMGGGGLSDTAGGASTPVSLTFKYALMKHLFTPLNSNTRESVVFNFRDIQAQSFSSPQPFPPLSVQSSGRRNGENTIRHLTFTEPVPQKVNKRRLFKHVPQSSLSKDLLGLHSQQTGRFFKSSKTVNGDLSDLEATPELRNPRMHPECTCSRNKDTKHKGNSFRV